MPSRTTRLGFAIARDRLTPSWPLLLGLAAVVRAATDPVRLLADPDTYLHVAAGRWMLGHLALPLADPFSHSMAGAAWLPHEWLAEIGLAAAFALAGWTGVVLLAAASFALAVALLLRLLLDRMEPLAALVAVVAAIALLMPHLVARPHLLALPLLVVWCGRLFAARDDDRLPSLWLLPVMMLWANLHASFVFGLALASFLAVEAVLSAGSGQARRAAARGWGIFLVVAVTAALVTPFGPAGLVQPFRLMAMPGLQSTFGEWLSPDFRNAPALELWILGAMFIGFATGVRLPLTRALLLVGLVHMTLQHARHEDLLAIVGPLAAAAPLGRALAISSASAAPSSVRLWFVRLAPPAAGPACLLALAVAVALSLPMVMYPIARADDPVTPGAALAAAERLGLAGPVYNSEAFGGYLLFRGVPNFIDGRVELYGDAFVTQDFQAENGNEAALAALFARYRIGWTLLLPQAGAVGVLDRLPGWQRVYADGQAVIHRRVDFAAR
jgi:hypothetical protein